MKIFWIEEGSNGVRSFIRSTRVGMHHAVQYKNVSVVKLRNQYIFYKHNHDKNKLNFYLKLSETILSEKTIL